MGFFTEIFVECTKASFTAGVLGNLVAGGVARAGTSVTELSSLLLNGEQNSLKNHDLVRALVAAQLEAATEIIDISLLEDYSAESSLGKNWFTHLQYLMPGKALRDQANDELKSLWELRGILERRLNALKSLTAEELDVELIVPLSDAQAVVAPGKEETTNPLSSHWSMQAAQTMCADLHQELRPSDMPEHLRRRILNGEWVDLFRVAFREQLKRNKEAETAYFLDAHDTLLNFAQRHSEDLASLTKAFDQGYQRDKSQICDLRNLLASLRSHVKNLESASLKQRKEIKGILLNQEARWHKLMAAQQTEWQKVHEADSKILRGQKKAGNILRSIDHTVKKVEARLDAEKGAKDSVLEKARVELEATLENYKGKIFEESKKKVQSCYTFLWARKLDPLEGEEAAIRRPKSECGNAERTALFYDYFQTELAFEPKPLRTVVQGAPGTGKTSLLWDISHWILNPASISRKFLTSLVPIYVPLASVSFEKDLETLISRLVSGKYDLAWQTSGPKILLLLDGLDEVSPKHMKKTLHEIRCLEQFDTQIVITSRTTEWKRELNKFEWFELLDLDSQQQGACVANCLKGLGHSELVNPCLNALNDRFSGVAGITAALSGLDPLRNLLGRPVFLVLIIRFFARFGRLPTTIGPVFKSHFDADFFDSDPERSGAKDVVWIMLASLAAKLTFYDGELAISLEELKPFFSERLNSIRKSSITKCNLSVEEVIQLSAKNDLLLIDGDTARFAHSTWQEFFCAVATQHDTHLRETLLQDVDLPSLVAPRAGTEWGDRVLTLNVLSCAFAIAPENLAADMLRKCLETWGNQSAELWNSALISVATVRGTIPIQVGEIFLSHATNLLLAGNPAAQYLFPALSGEGILDVLNGIAQSIEQSDRVRRLACNSLARCVASNNHRTRAIELVGALSSSPNALVRLGIVEGLFQTREQSTLAIIRGMLRAESPRGLTDDDYDSGSILPKPEFRIAGWCASKLLEHGEYDDRITAMKRCLTDDSAFRVSAGIHKALRFLENDKTDKTVEVLFEAFEQGDEQQRERCDYVSKWIGGEFLAEKIAEIFIHKKSRWLASARVLLERLLGSAPMNESLRDAFACHPDQVNSILPPQKYEIGDTVQCLWVSEHEGDEDRALRQIEFPIELEIARSFSGALTQLRQRKFHILVADDLFMSKGLDGSFLVGICNGVGYPTLLRVISDSDVNDRESYRWMSQRSRVIEILACDGNVGSMIKDLLIDSIRQT